MIVIDMDMPKSCEECVFFDGEDMCYADGTFALSQSAFENRPKWCPIKCDIEDIKAEIVEHQNIVEEALHFDKKHEFYNGKWAGIELALGVIDKHIGKEKE